MEKPPVCFRFLLLRNIMVVDSSLAPSQYSGITLMEEKGKVVLKQYANGNVVAKKGITTVLHSDKPNQIAVSYDGSKFHVVLNSSPLFTTFAAPGLTAGKVGFRVKSVIGAPVTFEFSEIIAH